MPIVRKTLKKAARRTVSWRRLVTGVRAGWAFVGVVRLSRAEEVSLLGSEDVRWTWRGWRAIVVVVVVVVAMLRFGGGHCREGRGRGRQVDRYIIIDVAGRTRRSCLEIDVEKECGDAQADHFSGCIGGYAVYLY